MSFYGLHTTKKAERDVLLERKGVSISIDPKDFHRSSLNKSIVIEEDTGLTYEHNIDDFFDLLGNIEKDGYDFRESAYYKRYSYKPQDVDSRLVRLRGLLGDIRKNGIKEPVHCEVTGERLDGSFRTKIAMFLGIKKIPAVLHKFNWYEIDEDFIERKLKARWLSSSKDYYEFEYGHNDWKNIPEGGEVYRENAEKADVIVPLVKGKKVLDLGCNEGYISIRTALEGKEVVGYDIDWNHIAYLNKLIFEYIHRKDLNIEFIEKDVLDVGFNRSCGFDTVLMLSFLYHIPRDKQEEFIRRFGGARIIFQCNLRKKDERDSYYTSHPDDLLALLKKVGRTGKIVEWKDKPIIIS